MNAQGSRIAVIGSLRYPAPERVRAYVNALPAGSVVVTGGGPGVDAMAEEAARARGAATMTFHTDWASLSWSAGPSRDRSVFAHADRAAVFWDRTSWDALNAVILADAERLPLEIYDPDGRPIPLDTLLVIAWQKGVYDSMHAARAALAEAAPNSVQDVSFRARRLSRVTFVDVEASGFKGYPIQVGWAIVGSETEEKPIKTGALFVRHDPWLDDENQWDPAAEAVHRIPRSLLRERGLSVSAVAEDLNRRFENQVLFSDYVPGDEPWIERIFKEAAVERRFWVADVAIPMATVDEMAYDYAERMIDGIAPHTHRADEDAFRWAKLYDMARIRWP